jgi:hypothetical protein
LLSLSDGQLLARINGRWYRSEDEGVTLHLDEGGLANLPDQPKTQQTGPRPRLPFYEEQYCRVRQATGRMDSLFAFCVRDDGAGPSSLCLYRSQDGGKSWSKPPSNGFQCHSDLPNWSPVAIWMDRDNPDIILMSWMAGGVYRSEDGGISWQRSDQGLRFRTPSEESGFLAISEQPLLRAVIERDREAIDRLLSEGADINAAGNFVSGVLEADLLASRYDQRSTDDSLYSYLHSRGAKPPVRRNGTDGILGAACKRGNEAVIEDLIRYGYDGSYLSDSPSQTSSEFQECIDGIHRRVSGESDDPLARWVDLYIQAGKFPSADQMVIELLAAQRPDLALKVLQRASRRSAFDAQSTPASQNRISIVPQLWSIRQYRWAQRVFLASTIESQSRDDQHFGQAISELCNPEIVEWYVAKGYPASYEFCLGHHEISLARRTRMLALMDAHSDLSPDVWRQLLEDADTRWVENTPTYRRYRRAIEPLRGLIGISYEPGHARLLIAGILASYPAQESGLQVGDEIVRINGVALTPQNQSELIPTIRGVPGSKVNLTVRRGEEELNFRLTRKRTP